MRLRILAFLPLLLILAACGNKDQRAVTVYVSVDQIYAEPILSAFEKQTGIRVLPVFDVEASKTTGLATRILAEKGRPRADVFWNGEFLQTLRLEQSGAVQNIERIGGRLRVLLVNTDKLKPDAAPRSMAALLASRLPPEQIGMALPLFGTSAAHAAALYATLGPEQAKSLYESIRKQGWRILDGNSVVRDQVASGQLTVGITDSDDACAAIASGASVRIVPLHDTLLVAGTVAMIVGAPHPAEARTFIDYIMGPSIEQRLIESGFAQISLTNNSLRAPCVSGLEADAGQPAPAQILAQFERSRADLTAIFLRAQGQ